MSGYPEIVAELIENGADPNLIDDAGYSPLALGIGEQTEECEEVCRVLRTRGAWYGLTEAAARGDLHRVTEVLRDDPKAAGNVPNSTALLSLLINVGRYGAGRPVRDLSAWFKKSRFGVTVAHGCLTA